MSEKSETVFSVTLDENSPKSLTLVVDPRLSCLDDSYAVHENTKTENHSRPLWILLGVLGGLFWGLNIALWLKPPILFSTKTNLSSCGIVWKSSHFNSWPLVTLFIGFLIFTVAIYWIWARHNIRIEKIASEERKQRFDMRKFLVEKSFDHAEKQAKANKNNDEKTNKNNDNTNKYLISITTQTIHNEQKQS